MTASDTSTDAGPIAVLGHVCLDLIPDFGEGETAGLDPGVLIEVGPAHRSTGGAVANTGLALHRLGVPVRLQGKLGDDLFGREIVRLLGELGHDLGQSMTVVDGEHTSYSVVINPPGIDRTFLHCPGANDTFVAGDVDWGRLEGASVVHFGYPPIMAAIRDDGGAGLRTIFEQARRRGAVTSLDMCGIDPTSPAGQVDWPAWLTAVLPAVDCFVPSLDETLAMLGRPSAAATPELLRGVAEELLGLGASVVMLKLGEEGVYLRTAADAGKPLGRLKGIEPQAWGDRELYAPCFEAAVAGTTGAGDCTIAGFLSALWRGATPAACLRSANAVGACSVEASDATSAVPAWSACQARLDAGWPQRPFAEAFAPWPMHDGLGVGPADAVAAT